jgi:hypothetical protein
VVLGIAMNFSSIEPIRSLYWSAVSNGVVAVPVMAMMMPISTNKRIMGKFTVGSAMRIVGWTATQLPGPFPLRLVRVRDGPQLIIDCAVQEPIEPGAMGLSRIPLVRKRCVTVTP